jgi:hypothetical protein
LPFDRITLLKGGLRDIQQSAQIRRRGIGPERAGQEGKQQKERGQA